MSATALPAAHPRVTQHHLASLPSLVVLALGYDSDAQQTPDDDPDLLSWVHAQAFPDVDTVHAAVVMGLWQGQWKRPRGLAWSDYPLVSDMAERLDPSEWKKARVHHGAHGRVRPAHILDADVALRGAKAVALLLTGPFFSALDEETEARTLAGYHRILTAAGIQGPTPVVVVRLGRPPLAVTVDTLPSLCADALARDRLLFSYGVNASVIHGRLLSAILDRMPGAGIIPEEVRCLPGDDLSLTQAQEHARQGMISNLASPLGLQTLYRLRALGPSGCPPRKPDPGYRRDKYPGLDLSVLGGGSDEDGNALWSGTGRHPPQPVTVHQADLTVRVIRRFLLARIVPDGVCGAGNLALTEAGHAFLDALHPDNEDPDCLLRWARPGTPDVEAMDSWVLRNFRKAKNSLSQSGLFA